MTTRLLSDAEFHAFFGNRMCEVTFEPSPVSVNIWDYVSAIPSTDFGSTSIEGRDVDYVYRTDDGRYDHVLISTTTKNVYLAIIVDLVNAEVIGHHILDLNAKYGLPTPSGDHDGERQP